ncbi:ATP-binding protein [Streptomyces sp. NPDC029003]|uniref:ATP-binding protein n=1 Tax=Streptomyces sp. NPDC029003 TaxID=3155125 RepID=UPI0033DA039E
MPGLLRLARIFTAALAPALVRRRPPQPAADQPRQLQHRHRPAPDGRPGRSAVSLTVRLLAVPEAAAPLRYAVRQHLGAGACPDAELCVSELLTNVITHLGEGTPVTLRVTGTGRAARTTRVELTDPDPRGPVPRTAADDAESGRGLALLAAVALRWGVDRRPGGKTVWCELAGAAGAGPSPAPRGEQRHSPDARGCVLLPVGSIIRLPIGMHAGTCLPEP